MVANLLRVLADLAVQGTFWLKNTKPKPSSTASPAVDDNPASMPDFAGLFLGLYKWKGTEKAGRCYVLLLNAGETASARRLSLAPSPLPQALQVPHLPMSSGPAYPPVDVWPHGCAASTSIKHMGRSPDCGSRCHEAV
eukprot:NODE_1174_length_969_cov_125.511957_g977_i0.p1 GENE.NODE_1174_length_969_cov_125.511957_g977_i0~~NODE_1174_length_969_cov_125.511957_g977_i0.p1  ORF type:complete len:138 (-),score=12.94 NODE_1174_length_969_cov_125.511957_g977_i0:180-593(-)